MSPQETYDQDTLQALAQDYVLGLLDHEQLTDFEDVLAISARARSIVAKTQEQLNQLALLSTPQRAPKSTWTGIQEQLRYSSSTPDTPDKNHDSEPLQSDRSHAALRWLPWLIGTNALLALALVLTIIYPGLLPTAPNPTAHMPYAAIFHNQSAEPLWYMRASEDMQKLYVKNTKSMPMDSNASGNAQMRQICFLWLQTSDGNIPIAPVPMDGSERQFTLSPETQEWLSQGAKLFITREQQPTGTQSYPEQPSEILEASGRLVRDPTLI